MTSGLITLINILILLGMEIGAPILIIGIMAIFKIRIKKEWQVYLYAFTAGLLLILGTVGFIGEAITHSKDYFIGLINNEAYLHTHESLDVGSTFQIIGVVGGGIILGILAIIFGRYIFTKLIRKNNNANCIHELHSKHNHNDFIFNASDIDNKKIKWMPILLLSGHRVIDGIVLGFMSNSSTIANFENWGMIIIFVLHLIPTSIVIYLIQLDIQKNNYFKAFIISIGLLSLMIPFTIIGGYLINNIQSIWWLMPLLYSISGSLMTLGGIMEVIPEFIHERNASTKQWIIIVLWLGFAIVLSVILLVIHSH